MDEEIFTTKDGRQVVLSWDEDYTFRAKEASTGSPIGEIRFEEEDMDSPGTAVLKLMWAHLEGCDRSYVRQGIGTRIVEIAKEMSGMRIVAADNDGNRMDDGSHLTGDAPAFVDKLKEKGLIAKSAEDYSDDYDD